MKKNKLLIKKHNIFKGNSNQISDPRKETLWDMTKYVCCPSFQWYSFLVIVSLIELVMFILTLIFSSDIEGDFLSPDTKTLIDFGAKDSYKIKNDHQIWRFLTSNFLHGNFLHFINNILTQLSIGISLESTIGPFKTFFIYIISGIGGVLLSALINDDISIGASTSVFGILGGYLGFLIVNWKFLTNRAKFLRNQLLCLLFVFLVLIVLTSFTDNDRIDNWGHLGGFTTGFFCSLLVITPIKPSNRNLKYTKSNLLGLISFILYFSIGFSCFFTLRKPHRI